MISNKWSTFDRNSILLAFAIGISILSGSAISFSLGTVLGQLITLIGLILGVWVIYAFLIKKPKSLSRSLKLEYKDAEFALRKLFKDKNIVFHRQEDDDKFYTYELLGRDLTATIIPYDPSLGVAGSPFLPLNEMMAYKHTLVTLQFLNTQNKVFAEELTIAIDEMVAPGVGSREKEIAPLEKAKQES